MNKHLFFVFLLSVSMPVFPQWSPTNGPGGGTINNIYEAEGTIFTAANGLYCSTDGGLNWEIKNMGLPLTGAVKCIYGDSEYLYAGIPSSGIFRSDDMGESWADANNGIPEPGYWINDIYEEGGTVYAATENHGIYISTDNGDNWTLKSNGLEGAALRVASIMKLNNILFVATPLGIFRSENEGDNWLPSSNGIPQDKVYSFDIVKKDNLLFVCALDGIYRSADEGLNWVKVGDDLFNTGIYTMDVYENKICSGTNGKMYVSTDDGNNWAEVGSGVTQYAHIYAINATENSLLCGVGQLGIFKHNPDDDLWYQSNAGLISENVSDMMVDGNDLVSVTVRNDFGQIFKSGNNGTEWNLSNNGTSDGGYNALINTGNHYLAGADGNFLFRSSDKGENWEKIGYPDFPATYVSSFCMKDGVVFAASFGNTIDTYRSTDDGGTWTGCNLPGNGNVMALLSTDEYVYSGRSDGVYRSNDLGITWIHASDGMSEVPFIKDFAVNDEYIFASANDGLYRSHNNGENWEKIYAPILYNQIESIATHEEYLFMGNKETGLLYSEDNGESWLADNPGFFQDPSGNYPTVIAIEIKGDSVYAAYQNFSIWVRPLPNLTAVEDELVDHADETNNLKIYPNPVKGMATISYSLSKPTDVSLHLYDMLGRERQTIVKNRQLKGEYQIQMDTREIDPGVYLIGLRKGKNISFQRILIAD